MISAQSSAKPTKSIASEARELIADMNRPKIPIETMGKVFVWLASGKSFNYIHNCIADISPNATDKDVKKWVEMAEQRGFAAWD